MESFHVHMPQQLDTSRTDYLRSCGQKESSTRLHCPHAPDILDSPVGHTKCWRAPPTQAFRKSPRDVSSGQPFCVTLGATSRRVFTTDESRVRSTAMASPTALMPLVRRGALSGSMAPACCLSCNYNLSETCTTRKPTPPNPSLQRRCPWNCPAVVEVAPVRTNFVCRPALRRGRIIVH